MLWNLRFFIDTLLLGLGLSADAFSLALVNGLRDSSMGRSKMLGVSAVFAGFQTLMPLLGWYFVRGLLRRCSGLEKYIPGISLLILLFTGLKMLRGEKAADESAAESFSAAELAAQGFASSLDALSAGIAIGSAPFSGALVSALIIGLLTFSVCFAGIKIGKKAGQRLAARAETAGGAILILLGFKIFFSA